MPWYGTLCHAWDAVGKLKANAPGTRILIAGLLEPHRERLSRLFDQMLDVIEDAFEAREIFLVRGVVVDGGPDHYAWLGGGEGVYSAASSGKVKSDTPPAAAANSPPAVRAANAGGVSNGSEAVSMAVSRRCGANRAVRALVLP